jgi:hypothetical protein
LAIGRIERLWFIVCCSYWAYLQHLALSGIESRDSFGGGPSVGPYLVHENVLSYACVPLRVSSGGASGPHESKVRVMGSVHCFSDWGYFLLFVITVVLFAWWCSSSSSLAELCLCGWLLGVVVGPPVFSEVVGSPLWFISFFWEI